MQIEKTVFICYRRTNFPWALAIYKELTSRDYDVFIDFSNIDSGSFERVILENIRARAHFIVVLTPSALERCSNPDDWLRREIECALDSQRNIIPLMFEGFDFGSPSISKYLVGKLGGVKDYNALNVPSDYFDPAMDRLCERFLNTPLASVLHPISESAALATQEQKTAANHASQVQPNELTSREWFEKGHKTPDIDEKVYCYKKAIQLDPYFAKAYLNLGLSYYKQKRYEEAIETYQQVIEMDPKDPLAYEFLSTVYISQDRHKEAISILQHAIELNPDPESASHLHTGVGWLYSVQNQFEEAVSAFTRATKLNPKNAEAYNGLGISYDGLEKPKEARQAHLQAAKLDPLNYG